MMDVEKLIKQLRSAAKLEGYYNSEYNGLYNQTADALEKLQGELEQVKRELDAAIASVPHECKTCLYHTVFFNGCTPDHDCTNPDGGCSNNYNRWEWRGQNEDGHETDD